MLRCSERRLQIKYIIIIIVGVVVVVIIKWIPEMNPLDLGSAPTGVSVNTKLVSHGSCQRKKSGFFTSIIVFATSQHFLLRKPVRNDSNITVLFLFIHRHRTLLVVRRV